MSKALSASVTFEALEDRVTAIEGGTSSLDGGIYTGPVTFGDTMFNTDYNGGVFPNIRYDIDDYSGFARASNTFSWVIGGALRFSVSATRVSIPLSQLSTYADNTAATTAGLAQGDLYRTSTGQLMVRY